MSEAQAMRARIVNEFAGALDCAKAKMVAAGKHAVGSTRDAERRTTLREFGDEVFDIADAVLAALTPQPDPAVEAMAAALEEMLVLFGNPHESEYVDGGASYLLACETVINARAALATYRASREQENTR